MRNVGEQTDGLEQVSRHYWNTHVQLEGSVGGGKRDGRIITNYLCRNLNSSLTNHRVYLAGHNGRAGLQIGDVQLA